MLRLLGDGIAEIKRMWVDPTARGLGLGRRPLGHLESLARADDCRAIRLDTNATLLEAIALYDRSGYRRIPRYNDNPYARSGSRRRWIDRCVGTVWVRPAACAFVGCGRTDWIRP